MYNVYRKIGSVLAGMALLALASMAIAAPEPSYVRQDLDLSKYTQFQLRSLNMDNIQVLKPVWEDDPEPWSFQSGDREAVQQMFREIMTQELSKDGGYPVVEERGEDVMTLEVEILSITPYVKPGTKGEGGGFVIETLGSGEVVVSAEFRDSVTRELLILLEGERPIGTEYREVSRENHEENIRQLFTTWGQRVRAAMDQAHGK